MAAKLEATTRVPSVQRAAADQWAGHGLTRMLSGCVRNVVAPPPFVNVTLGRRSAAVCLVRWLDVDCSIPRPGARRAHVIGVGLRGPVLQSGTTFGCLFSRASMGGSVPATRL